jgi:WD40 repeat protein
MKRRHAPDVFSVKMPNLKNSLITFGFQQATTQPHTEKELHALLKKKVAKNKYTWSGLVAGLIDSNRISINDTVTNQITHFPKHTTVIRKLVRINETILATLDKNWRVHIWDILRMSCKALEDAAGYDITSLRNNLLAINSRQSSILVYNCSSFELHGTLPIHSFVRQLHDGSFLVYSKDYAEIYDAKCETKLHHLTESIFNILETTDGLLCFCSFPGPIRVWDRVTETFKATKQVSYVVSMQAMSDGTLLVCDDEQSPQRQLRVWDVNTGKCLQTISVTDKVFSVFEIEPNLVGSADSYVTDHRRLRTWKVSTGQCLNDVEIPGSMLIPL